ncbi:hypothetical protein AB4304_16285 [Vibrio breoganii]
MGLFGESVSEKIKRKQGLVDEDTTHGFYEETYEIPMSTTNSLNYTEEEHVGAVFSEKLSVVSRLTLNQCNSHLTSLRREVLVDLVSKAEDLGANGIVSVNVNMDLTSGHVGLMSSLGGNQSGDLIVCVSAQGTAIFGTDEPN